MQTSTELSVRDVRPTPSQASPSCPSGASMARYRKGPPIRSEAYWTTGVAPHAFSLSALVYTPAACVSCSSLRVLCARLYTGARVGPFRIFGNKQYITYPNKHTVTNLMITGNKHCTTFSNRHTVTNLMVTPHFW